MSLTKKGKVTITIIISCVVVLTVLLFSGYLFLRQYIPEVNISTGSENKSAGWTMDKSGTVHIYGEDYLPDLYWQYDKYIVEAKNGMSFLTNMADRINPGFHCKRVVIDKDVLGYSETKHYLDYAFALCYEVESIEVDENNLNLSSEDGVLFNKDKTVLLRYPTGSTRTEYTVPDSVTEIAAEAFADCRYLKTVICAGTLESIDKAAFQNSNLETVIFSGGVINIGEVAFNNCVVLRNVEFGSKTESIGDYAFYGCEQLLYVSLPDSLSVIGYQALGFFGNKADSDTVAGFSIICSDTANTAKDYAEENGFAIKSE